MRIRFKILTFADECDEVFMMFPESPAEWGSLLFVLELLLWEEFELSSMGPVLEVKLIRFNFIGLDWLASFCGIILVKVAPELLPFEDLCASGVWDVLLDPDSEADEAGFNRITPVFTGLVTLALSLELLLPSDRDLSRIIFLSPDVEDEGGGLSLSPGGVDTGRLNEQINLELEAPLLLLESPWLPL